MAGAKEAIQPEEEEEAGGEEEEPGRQGMERCSMKRRGNVELAMLASAIVLVASSAMLAQNAARATGAGANETLDEWIEWVSRSVVPEAGEDALDEDHLPRRPRALDDRVFAETVKSVGSVLRKKRILAANGSSSSVNATARIIVVAKDGSGRFRTVQAAINSLPVNNAQRVIIYVKKGIYAEKVLVPSGRQFVTLKGESAALTTIQWGDTASTLGKDGKPLGTYGSASVAVEADNFIALDISFKNTARAPAAGAVGRQAVALRIQGDKAAFYRCNFYGAQDTLYDKEGRHYYYNCFIEGSIDFIFGDARSLFYKCSLHSIANPYGSISAQKRESALSNTGFSFVSCVLSGTGSIYLGRAWGAYSRVVFAYTYLAAIITPEGWNDFGVAANQKTAFYGEYKCSGPGASRLGRVRWSRALTDLQARPFLSVAFIDGAKWLPK